MNKSIRYRRYRAPAGDGQVLCDPSWNSLPQQIEQNRSELADCDLSIGGKSLAAMREEARKFLVSAAKTYTGSYSDTSQQRALEGPLVVTGHQPGLHHPGVWLKNFAAGRLAKRVAGTAINIVIDSDLCRATAMPVPTGTADDPRLVNVPWDKSSRTVPYEERLINNPETWNSFGKAATRTIAPLISSPLLQEWWPEVLRLGVNRRLGETLSQARHLLELSWGNETWEVPYSHVCCSETFHRFVLHLLSNAEAFRTIYNRALAEYRNEHRLRNQAQPVPDLSEEEGWIESPLWVWSSESPTRRPLYVSQSDGGLKLTDRADFHTRLENILTGSTEKGLHQLQALENEGIKLRTRALTTTMFARLFLSDIFIHGIGGAKYDQVTDEICSEFFGIRPPTHATITATLRLPIAHSKASPGYYRETRQELRNLRYHPEVTIDRDQLSEAQQRQFDNLSAEKRKWITLAKTPENCEQRHKAIEQINRQLNDLAVSRREEIVKELAELDHRIRADRLLESREYPFCLFPQLTIQDFLLDFTASIP